MKVGSLCTGYGGIELGLRLAGEDIDLRWLAEFDPALDPLHPTGVPNLGDITRVDWSSVEPVDLLTAGFPCQPFSAAGRQQAEDDHRYLWPAVRDAVETLMPDRVLLENVRNLVSMRKGEIWARILDDLTQLGYGVTWFTLGACRVGAAHHRHRVFALAQARDGGVQRLDVQECGTKAPLLPTPQSRDGQGRGTPSPETANARFAAGRRNLDDGLALLPTPSAVSYGSNQGGAAGRIGPVRHSLESLVRLALLPTPTVGDSRNSRNATAGRSPDAAPANSGTTLSDVAHSSAWGRFAEAVARHESLYGPAPAPAEPNRNGAPRLAPAFAEWLMCIPVGHVTDALPRKDALKAIGNGVCPPQLAAAWQLLTGAAVDIPSDTSIGSGAMTSSTTTTSSDVKDIQDRQANGRAAVIDATMVNGITVDPKLIEAAMMALVEHWRAEAQIWEDSKRRGGIGTAKELRIAAGRLAAFAVGLTTRPIAQINTIGQLEQAAQDARSIIEQVDPAGVDFAAIQEATEEENLREMIGPLGANAIMDNPFVSPSINARPNITIPFFALTDLAAKLDADDLGRRERVSHSYVESYEKCSLAALLRDASRAGHIGAQRPGWSTIGGNAFHAAVNVVETAVISAQLISIAYAEELWGHHFNVEIEAKRQELAGTPYADPSTWYVSNRGKEGYDWWRVEGARMLETYLKFHDQAWRAANQTLMVKDSTPCLELAYEMTVRSIDGERGITSKGFIDRAILSLGDHPTHPWHITVVDYKTGARDPISTFQLGEYAHALLLEMGLTDEPPGRPILGSYWLARKGIYTTPVPVIARHPLHELQYRYDAAMRGTTAGVFAPHVTNMCSSCSMIDYCPAQAGRT